MKRSCLLEVKTSMPRDPFGHEWSLIAQMEPVSDEELREGASQTWPEHARG